METAIKKPKQHRPMELLPCALAEVRAPLFWEDGCPDLLQRRDKDVETTQCKILLELLYVR